MPVIRSTATVLALLLCSTHSVAVESLWPALSTARLSVPTQFAPCRDEPPEPYTGALQFKSKYNQSDASKSSLSLGFSPSTWLAGKRIKDYLKGLQRASRRAEQASSPEKAAQALGCLSLWLDSWAAAGALESRDASKTGMAARKWALAAVASSLLRARALSGDRYRPEETQLAWLERLADIVIDDYQPRRVSGFRYYNNHDYWAAWAVAAVGMLGDREDYLEWGFAGLQPMFGQLVEVEARDYAYLPVETARGKLGAEYTHYAMVPLTLLVEAREANGRPLSEREHELFGRLASFAARSALEADSLPELSGRQREPSRHKMIWLVPFLARYPEHAWARRLYDRQNGDVDGYSQVGGSLKPLYPAFGQ